MLPSRELTYSTKLRTLRECLWQQSLGASISANSFDYESFFNLLISRTDLSPTEAGNLDTREMMEIWERVRAGIAASVQLANLSDQLAQTDADLAPDTTDNQPQADNTP